jgi:hypothetical protein
VAGVVGTAVGCGAVVGSVVGTTVGCGGGVLVTAPDAPQPANISATAKPASEQGRMPRLIVVSILFLLIYRTRSRFRKQ